MKTSQDENIHSKTNPDKYKEYECDDINIRGKEYSCSRGDFDEQKTGVFDWDIANDVSRFSAGICNMLGLEQSHIARGYFSAFQYVPPEEWQKLQDVLMLSLQNKTAFEAECRAVKVDGTFIQIRIAGKLTCDSEGAPVYLAGTIEDVTGQQ